MTSHGFLKRNYPSKPSDVYLFSTCLIDQFTPQAGLNTVNLLEREGIRVHFPGQQTCCGQPAHSSGYPSEARSVALAQLNLFVEPWPVVVPSGSCGGMIRSHYPHLFAHDPELYAKAVALSNRVYELSEFLVHVVHFSHRDQGTPCTIALHTSCHARRQMGVHDTSAALLDSLENVQVKEQVRIDECCGFGGTFALLYPDISEAIATDKVAAIKATGASCVVSADCGCLLNITGRSAKQDELAGCQVPSLPGEHLATFLWQRTHGGPV
ncbi:lactate utilization protein A [Rhodoferax lithotrophicus]|uniref:Lactate utilization protein A n=1 Tax=Rhodoferax lithotrophicus TaxID=2798804 RepID=A0ABN6D833_9BURK|nr:(Fe-S)-binding protein [Rhodoferax sp. MIZ03]BCO27873.1 lactate utilization protein A [Rhodoferax sp. MIZ03]